MADPAPDPRYKSYLIALLTAILVVNYADRLVFGVVLQDIKAELQLSDTQLGLLSGIAFALFYSTMGIPIARLADRGYRVRVISVCTALWSVAVAFCGAAGNFIQLLLLRMGVAVGESGCYAPSLSLISHHFRRTERPRAVGRYMLGLPLAMIVGYLAAGWLNELYGWRMTFVLFGLPGIILGPLAWWSLREPTGAPAGESELPKAVEREPTLKQTCVILWTSASFRHLFVMFTVWGFFALGILQWQPAFYVRSHGLSTGELGTWLAVVQGGGGLIGTYFGGEWAAKFASNNERLQLVAIAIGYALLSVMAVAAYVVSSYELSFAILAIYSVVAGACNGPLFATIQTVVHPQMRSIAVALMYLSCNLIGLGLGPLAVGILSDVLRPSFGEESLRCALLIFCPGYLWCAWHLWQASRTVTRDLLTGEKESALVSGRSAL